LIPQNAKPIVARLHAWLSPNTKMTIDYTHSNNLHTLDGPAAVIPMIIADANPRSILDVGCGVGTWLKVATDLGVQDCYGVDGVDVSKKFLLSGNRFTQQDLTKTWDLHRKFDLAICLEVAEHLDEAYAGNLIEALANHSDLVLFSAACPGQEGQHHVNCQWPAYWQGLFNDRGYVCDDSLRWRIWDDSRIEPWYRQNIFVARRAPQEAGKERRINAVVHPKIWSTVTPAFQDYLRQIEEGSMPSSWYVRVIPSAFTNKLRRHRRR
jgi:SAM-dependent methyltransferase